MPHYEFFCHSCNRPFSKTFSPMEHKDARIICPYCGSEEVEQRWFYLVAANQSA